MPFVKVDINKEIEKSMEDREYASEYEAINREFEIIKQATETRKKLGITQPEVAERIGAKQQSISRMEQMGNSPSLRNFIRYLDGIGLEMKIEKKC